MDKAGELIIGLMTSVISVAILAVLVSKNSQTGTLISTFGTAFSGILSTALGPVTDGSATDNIF